MAGNRTPLFETVAIVGVGLIGGSIGMALRRRNLAKSVLGVGRRRSVLDQARKLGAIDRGSLKFQAVRQAELVVICTPVDLIASQTQQIANESQTECLVTDVGSTKAEIVDRIERLGLPASVEFVGSHPLAGSEKQGVRFANGDLFEGKTCVITPTERNNPDAVESIDQFWRRLGMRTLRLTPKDHDKALAYTSHVPHAVAAALSIFLPNEYAPLTAAGYLDTTRIAASDPAIWSSILLQNKAQVLASCSQFNKSLRTIVQALRNNDREALVTIWEQSRTHRMMLEEDR